MIKDKKVIDTVYGFLPYVTIAMTAWVLSVKNRDHWNWAIFVALSSCAIIFMIGQDLLGSNSPSAFSMFLYPIIGLFISTVALKTKTAWPLVISVFLLMSGVMAFCHHSATLAGLVIVTGKQTTL